MTETKYTHGHIIPLVGGSVLGTTKALQTSPSWIASWGSVFGANDKYTLQYFDTTPYYELDNVTEPRLPHVDIVTCLPPCAGLSTSNTTKGSGRNPHGCSAPSNVHMLRASEFAMQYVEPRAIMVENAPLLYSKSGEEFAERINQLAQDNGYTMSLIKTTTLNHGVPQERTRSFFFLWRHGSKVPILEQIKRPHLPFHEFLAAGDFAPSPQVSNKQAPSTDPTWQFVQSKFAGWSKQQILAEVAAERMWSVWDVITQRNWLEEACSVVTEPRANRWLNYTLEKTRRGGRILDGSMKLAWKQSSALMWKHMPVLMHPHEDRWLMVSEALGLMGYPSDFARKVHIDTKHSNVICQNVPVCTAGDWVGEVAEALSGNRQWVDPERKTDGTYKILRQSNVTKNRPMRPVWDL